MKHQTFTFKVLACSCMLLFQIPLWSQDVAREIGIATNSLENFSAIYKWQKAPDQYKRLSVAGARITTDLDEAVSSNLEFTLGTEKRRQLAEQTEWFRGLQYGVSVGYVDQVVNDPRLTVGVGLSYLLGLQYQASSRFNFGLEWLPGISLSYRDDTETLTISASADFSNARIFGVYKFMSPSKK